MEREYKCKCGNQASYFYLVSVGQQTVSVWNDLSYWSNKGDPRYKNGFVFVCARCLPKVLSIEKLKGYTPVLLVRQKAGYEAGYEFADISLKEYTLKTCG